MSLREGAAKNWAQRVSALVDAGWGTEEANAILRVAMELIPLELLVQESVEAGFRFAMQDPQARRILKLPEVKR